MLFLIYTQQNTSIFGDNKYQQRKYGFFISKKLKFTNDIYNVLIPSPQKFPYI